MACTLYSADSVTLIFKEAQLKKYQLDLQMERISGLAAFKNFKEQKDNEISEQMDLVEQWKGKFEICTLEKKDVISKRE